MTRVSKFHFSPPRCVQPSPRGLAGEIQHFVMAITSRLRVDEYGARERGTLKHKNFKVPERRTLRSSSTFAPFLDAAARQVLWRRASR